ncbi:hypothetical protein SUGI_1146020 [Cryptomeria japonica]|uniref:uncharacterized protein LOC131859842 n=1 Tax=Cryptomeria japonica TaxID=3369 RepID=UPI002414B2A2|nr:uncharacterized protein LOC131859842 [Cryptomeria japonica]GLJ53710.1 hypothetical protein SUGI_1146020 [Cryptomeria japonica]
MVGYFHAGKGQETNCRVSFWLRRKSESVDQPLCYQHHHEMPTPNLETGPATALTHLWPSSDPHSQSIIPDFLHEGNSDKTITGSILPLNSFVIILSSFITVQGEN